jgi:hypothetical protein
MTPLPLHELFKIAPGPVPLLLLVRVALAVGLPLVGFTLAGQPVAAVAGGATAMFVTQCDVGSTGRGRTGMMLLGLLAVAAGGVVSDKLGGSTGIDELLVIASAFVAAWVSNSQPGWPRWRASARWPPPQASACKSPIRWRWAPSLPVACVPSYVA